MLKNAFDAFDQEKNGFINTTMVGTILGMLGHQLDEKMLMEIVAEVDEDGSGQIEFEEFCTLAARFLVEEDAEAMQQELKEAFRLYDKEGKIPSICINGNWNYSTERLIVSANCSIRQRLYYNGCSA